MGTRTHRHLALTIILTLWPAGSALSADPILTLSGSADKPLAAPHVAFNTVDKLFLAVYEFHFAAGDWDIDGQLVDANGRLVGTGLAVAWKGSVEQQEPDVAYNPVTNQFLVAYVVKPSSETTKISACVVAGDGTPGPFVAIATDADHDEYHPAVACDPTTGHYLVVYELLNSAGQREVWGQDVLASGVRPDDPFRLSNPDVDSRQCAVACAGGQFLVVWRQEAGGKGVILGRIIQCGYPAKTTLTVASAKDSANPQVAYNPARAEYLVVYQDRTISSARWIVEGTRVSTLCDVTGVHTITKATATDEHCQTPDVAYDGADGQYVVTWAQGPATENPTVASHQTWAQRVDGDGEPAGAPEPVSGPGKSQPANPGIPAPAVAAGFCGNALIIWEDQTQPNPSTTVYSILGVHGSRGSLCCDPNCNSGD